MATANLAGGKHYEIFTPRKSDCNKSLIFVKLTDSALRLIEQCVRDQGAASQTPTIQLQNNNGVITLPINGNNYTYNFTLSNVEADGLQGSFECVQQTNRSLQSLGCMDMKMHILGKEDSYAKIKDQVAATEQENKKNCTKEIKPNDSRFARNLKRPAPVLPSVKVIPFSNPLQNISRSKLTNGSEISRQPIRERIIHILAIRPYKRPEILLRLMSEGISEEDRKEFVAILPKVSILKVNNVYTLANNLWNEVQEDWKFCSQDELKIIQKKKQQFLKPNTQLSLEKRIVLLPPTNGVEPNTKKQRISHYNHAENPDIVSSSSKSSAHAALVNGKCSKSTSIPNGNCSKSTSIPNGNCSKSTSIPNGNRQKNKKKKKKKNAKKRKERKKLKCSLQGNKREMSVPTTNGLKLHAKQQKTSHSLLARNGNVLTNSSNFTVLTNEKNSNYLLPPFSNSRCPETVIKNHQEVEKKLNYSSVQNLSNFVSAHKTVAEPPMKKPKTSNYLHTEDISNLDSSFLPQRNGKCLDENTFMLPPKADTPVCINEKQQFLKVKRETGDFFHMQKCALPVPATNGQESSSNNHKTSCTFAESSGDASNYSVQSKGDCGSENELMHPSDSDYTEYVDEKQQFLKVKRETGDFFHIQKCALPVPATNGQESSSNNHKTSCTFAESSGDASNYSVQSKGDCGGENELMHPSDGDYTEYVDEEQQFTKVKMKTNECSMQKGVQPVPAASGQELSSSNRQTICSFAASSKSASNYFVHSQEECSTENELKHPAYIKEYGPIESSEQHSRYKADYNAQYEEYMLFFSKIKSVSEKLTSLADNLHMYEKGSEKFIKYRSKICKVYQAYERNQSYVDALKKFNYLHFKLAHIKQLITEYDSTS